VGAIASGMPIGLPNSVVCMERPDMSTSERGRSLMRSNPARLLRRPTSSSVPRSTNSNTPRGRRRFAASRRSLML
jgi:hypothetical protein